MSEKKRRWNTVINGDNVPKDDRVVVGMWLTGECPYAELCHYEEKTREWLSNHPETTGDSICEPDYWIETPN